MRTSKLPRLAVHLAVCLLAMEQAAFPGDPAASAENRFNVLFIAVDDLRPELGCYGVSAAQSPEFDAFARTAIRFDRHFVQSATCGASRYALLTGRSPASSGVVGNNEAFYKGAAALQRQETRGAQSLPELFRRSGYRTVCLGKISHTPDGRVFAYDGGGDGRRELPHAWDELPTPFGPWKRGWGAFFAYSGGRHREDGKGHQDLMEFTAERDEDLPDGLLATAAIEQLRELSAASEPFFLGLGFYKPHLPLVATRGDWEAFEGVEIPLTPAPERIVSPYWHKSGEFYRYDFPFPKERPLAVDDQRQTRRAYLACVRYVDRQAGRVLSALDELGLADNTIVVVWGDHGWHLGDEQIWGKHTPFEEAVRSVLMLRAPGVSEPGVSQALVETIDLYPTLVDLCRPAFRETEHPLDGISLAPLLRGQVESVREASLSYWRDAVSIRTPRYRLAAKRSGGRLAAANLFDVGGETPQPLPLEGRDELVESMLRLARERMPTQRTDAR
jgi:arylsulfatase A-like enzyme